MVDLPDLARRAPSEAVVVVDVLRACTTAAAALAAGAQCLLVAGEVDEARDLAGRSGGAVLAGEVDGFPVAGFDLTNSPVEVAAAQLAGRTVVLRTTAGTQGLLGSVRGGPRVGGTSTQVRRPRLVLAGAFVTAGATLAALRALHPPPGDISFVITGSHSADRGDEDRALADYLAASLCGGRPDPAPYLARARSSTAAARFLAGGDLESHAADLEACLALDRYDFAVRLVGGDPPRLVLLRP